MNCIGWEERVALYAGDDLVDSDMERHLAECAACREFCAEIRAMLTSLREEHGAEIQAAEFAAVRSGVIAEIERGRRVWRRLAWASGVGIAAALVMGLALRPGPLLGPPPRVAVNIPSAVMTPRAERRAVSPPQAASLPHKKREAVLVKLQTSDPNIVIYWIAD
jgi:hypothetical protein